MTVHIIARDGVTEIEIDEKPLVDMRLAALRALKMNTMAPFSVAPGDLSNFYLEVLDKIIGPYVEAMLSWMKSYGEKCQQVSNWINTANEMQLELELARDRTCDLEDRLTHKEDQANRAIAQVVQLDKDVAEARDASYREHQKVRDLLDVIDAVKTRLQAREDTESWEKVIFEALTLLDPRFLNA